MLYIHVHLINSLKLTKHRTNTWWCRLCNNCSCLYRIPYMVYLDVKADEEQFSKQPRIASKNKNMTPNNNEHDCTSWTYITVITVTTPLYVIAVSCGSTIRVHVTCILIVCMYVCMHVCRQAGRYTIYIYIIPTLTIITIPIGCWSNYSYCTWYKYNLSPAATNLDMAVAMYKIPSLPTRRKQPKLVIWCDVRSVLGGECRHG